MTLGLRIPCEYNRLIKKRGKGSELYPHNPRKTSKKISGPKSTSNGSGSLNNDNNDGDVHISSSRESGSPPSERQVQVITQHAQSSNSTGEPATQPTTDPYAALMRLADTSEQHHQMSEQQLSDTAQGPDSNSLKRKHSIDLMKARKTLITESTNDDRIRSVPSSSAYFGINYMDTVHETQNSYAKIMSNIGSLPPINDIKSGTLDSQTPISQSPSNLPSISSTPIIPGSPSEPLSLPSVNIDQNSIAVRNSGKPSAAQWAPVKSPLVDILGNYFDKTNPLSSKALPAKPAQQDTIKAYPVFDPISVEIDFMPTQLMSEFLEIYFTDHTFTVAPILRRSSLLSMEKPRKCSPVLLYSILYVSAHACTHPLITSTPDYKLKLTTKLLERVMSYMRPWKNDNSHEYDLDEIIAYINVGVVSSASEFKGSSLRWWAIAWCMARVLKLNKEIPTLPEETREERRRAWWTLFMVDRHLGLCYNRPCTLLDSESLELFFPVSADLWDSDKQLYPPEDDRNRRRGPQCTVIEAGLFGMYLPLMTLLGGINDMHFLEMSPVLGGKEQVLKILRESYYHRLSAFQFSLEEYYSHMLTKPSTLLRSWKEYCECFIQVFYILLEGFWDPTDMLDDIDVLLNDSKFSKCLANSIQASKHVEKILVLDPDLQVIPFFFGIQLLQAGFIPFCMSERYGSHTSTDVAHACEIFIRAHEVCIVTLSTQYQVHFRFIMRGVIRDMKHATVSVNDRIDSTRRRREIMSMYRWNAGGTGLAI